MSKATVKIGDKVKSLVDYCDIRKGEVLTVERLTEESAVLVKEHEEGQQLLLRDEYEKIEGSPMTIEQLLTKANHHAAKATKHERKRDELIQQARELMPEGWELTECEPVKQPEEDMTNPENWRAGDVVECVRQHPELTVGRDYLLLITYSGDAYDGDGDVRVIDDDGDKNHYKASFFRWLRRPSAQD